MELQARKIHQAVAVPGDEAVVFRAAPSEKYKRRLCCCAALRCDVRACMHIDDVWHSTYVTVWEHKIETSYPVYCYCCMVRIMEASRQCW